MGLTPRRPHALGPLMRVVALGHPVFGRLYATAVALAAGATLAVAAGLTPNRDDLGRRVSALGIAPCGFVRLTRLPCPTCGMTTAYAYTVRGHLFEAVRTQMAGFVLATATAGTALAAGAAAVTGRRPSVNWYRINPARAAMGAAGLFVAAWAGKILIGLVDGSLPVR